MAQQSITLQTSDSDVVSGDVLGRINFAASNESSGSEAKWIGASVYAEASGEFTASVNPTNLVFATSDADGIVARHRVTNVGHFVPLLNTTYNLGASNLKYNNIFAATGTLDRVVATGIQLTGSASQSGLLYINNSNLISSSPNVLFSNADLASPKLIFKASGTTTPDLSLNILTTASGTTSGVQTLSIQGSAGELFSITDVLDSGTIFSVNDISGLSLIEADASGVVTLVRYGTNVAVGDLTPTQKLHVGGNLRVSGAYYDSLNSPGTSGHILVSTSGGTSWRSLNQLTGVDGSGTAGYVARWTDTDTIGSGLIFDNGTNIGIGDTNPSDKLVVNGRTRIDGTNKLCFGASTGGWADIGVLVANSGTIVIRNYDGAAIQERMRIIGTNGNVGINSTSPTAKLHIETGAATTTGVIVRAAASQTADLLQIQNSAGTTLLDIDAAGSLSGVGSGIFMQRVGVGTSNPISRLTVDSGDLEFTTNGQYGIRWPAGSRLYEETASTGGVERMLYQPNGDRFEVLTENGVAFIAGFHGNNSSLANSIRLYRGTIIGNTFSSNNSLAPPGNGLLVEGNVGIGTINPTARLQIVSSGTSSSTFAFIAQNTTPTNLIRISDDGRLIFGPGVNQPRISVYNPNGGDGVTPDFSFPQALLFYTDYTGPAANNGYFTFNSASSSQSANNDSSSLVSLRGGVLNSNATTGSRYTSLSISPTINQTTGSSTVRGIWYSPTVTSASGVTHRAIETNRGDILFQNVSTPLFYVQEASGNVGIGTTSPAAKLHIETGSATATGVIIRGSASQSADLLQIQNSAGTTLLDIDAAGSLSGVGSGIFMQRVGIANASPQNLLTIGTSLGTAANTNSTAGYGLGIHHSGIIVISPETAGNNAVHNLINLTVSKPAADWGGQATIDFNIRDRGNNYPSRTAARITAGDANGDIGRGIISFATALNSGVAPSTAMTIINNGNVGIGTTSPTQRLHVSGNIRLAGALFDSLNLPGASGQVLVSTSGGVEWRTSSGGIDGTGSANYLARWIDADTLGTGIVYDNGTNVGIGTASPSTRLHIRRTSGDFIRLGVNDANANGVGGNIEWYTNEAVSADYLGGLRMQFSGGIANSNRQMQFLVGDVTTPKAIINGTGNMGIGTTSPAVKLDVVGDFAVQKTDGGYFVNNYFNGDTPVFGYYGATGLIFATVTTRTGGGYTERVRFDNNGNVGIGTASPTQKLDVRGNTYVSGVLTVSSGNFGESIVFHNGYKIRSFGGGGLEILSNPYTRIGNTGGAQVANFTAGTNIGAGLNITPIASQTGLVITGAASQTADLFQAQNSAGTALVRVDAAGSISGVASGIFMQRVGIGTSNPSYPLDVNGNAYIAGSILLGGYAYYGARFGTYLWANADTTIQTSSGYGIGFNVHATEIARITSSGLGIGTTSPTRALDVRGSAFISGALYDSTNSAGTNGQVLTSTATGTDWKSLSEIVGVDGVGTSGYVARWIDGDTIGTGVIYDNGTNVGVRTTAPSTTLDVRGTGYFSESIRTSGTVVFASGNTGTAGVMQWNNGEGTVQLGLKGGNVNVELAQDNVVLCYNGVGSSLSKGQVVYASGAQGQRPSVNLALATSDLSSARTIGLVDETIGVGAEGFVATFGVVTNLNTSALTAGSGLWLSATTPGAITMTRPVAPNHGVFLGWCLNSHASAGRIFINVQNGAEIEELHDVLIQNVASGDVLQYDSSNLTWRNRTRSQAGLVEGVGTSGYAARWISANVIGTGVVYDNGTNVGIGTTSPTAKLHIETGSAATSGILVRGAFAQTADYLRVQDSSSGNVMRLDNNAGLYLGAGSGVTINAGLIKIGEDPNASAGGKFFVIYNTFGSVNSYERLNIGWRAAPYDTNVAYISTENSLGGTIRDIAITHDDYTAVGADTMRFKAATQFVGVCNESPTARFHVNTNSATVTGVIVQGAASQTADLLQIQNSAGTTLLDIDAAGSLSGVGSGVFMQRVGAGTSAPTAQLHVNATTATTTGVIVRGASAQTADLFQVQNSAGTALVRVDAAGSISGVASGLFNYIGLNNPSVKYSSRFDILETGVKINNTIFTIYDASTVVSQNDSSAGYKYATPSFTHSYKGSFRGLITSMSADSYEQVGVYNSLGYARKIYGTYTAIENVETSGYGSYVGFVNDDSAATLSKAVGYGMNWTGGDLGAYSNNPNIIGVELNINDILNEYATIYGLKADIGFGNGSVAYGFYITGAEASYLSHSLGLGRTIPSAKLDLVTPSNSEIGAIIRASSAAQTADLQQWLNSASGVLLRVDAAGSISGVASGIFGQNLRVANIPAGSSETDVVLVKTDGTFVKRPSSSLGVGGGSGISNEDSIINALIFG